MSAVDAPLQRGFDTSSPRAIKRRVRDGIESLMYVTGGAALCSTLSRRRGAVILMYHSVPPPSLAPWIDPRNAMHPAVFREQMRFLSERRRVVSMAALAAMLERGETPPRGTVVLTFDDGYRDNLEVVAPILNEFQLPATLYLATGYVARRENQWVDQLYAAFRTRSRTRVEIRRRGSERIWQVGDSDAARDAYFTICELLLESSSSNRRELLEAVVAQLAPIGDAPRLTLSWDEVRAMRAQFPGIEIGGHTRDHVDLTHCDEQVFLTEVNGCADDIARELGARPAHFSFPYGRSTEETRRIVTQSGFKTAVTSGSEVLITSSSDLHGLCRVEAPVSRTLFRHRTSGAPGLRLSGALS